MREPRTILHLIDCLNPGGTERQLIEQCRRMDRDRWRPLVATFHGNGTLRHELEALEVPISTFPLRRRLAHLNTARQLIRLVRHCRRERVRIVHAHDFYANLLGAAVANVTSAHLITSRRDLAHWLTPAQRTVLGFACRRSDRVLTNGHAVARATVHELGVREGALRLVPNGIDLGRFDAEATEAPHPPLPPDDGATSLAMVSNMNLSAKGHSDLLAAASLLASRGHRLRLLLVGDGPERPRLEEEARQRGLGAEVCFLGRRLDVPRLLPRIDLFCLPSWAEGFPNVLLEAMAAERPVVTTEVGSCPELVEPGVTGLLVPPRAPPRLADAIEWLLAHGEEARAMGRQARRRIAAEFTMERSALALDSLYRELV